MLIFKFENLRRGGLWSVLNYVSRRGDNSLEISKEYYPKLLIKLWEMLIYQDLTLDAINASFKGYLTFYLGLICTLMYFG